MLFFRRTYSASKYPIPSFRHEETAYSAAILEQVRDISRLDTIEFVYKTVFPYDLIGKDTDFRRLVSRFKDGEKLGIEEIKQLSVLGIAAEAGIDLLEENYEFTVISARIKAGFDFGEDVGDSVRIDRENSRITIDLPPAVITDIIIEDSHSGNYEYPDIDVSPEQWKTLTAILSEKLVLEAAERDITGIAEERGRELIRGLFSNAGFSEIMFE